MEGDTKTDLVGKRLQTRLREIYEEEYLRRQTQQNACISCWIFYNWQPVDQSQCNSAFPSAHFKILPAALFFHGIMGREEMYIPQTSLLPLHEAANELRAFYFRKGIFCKINLSRNLATTVEPQIINTCGICSFLNLPWECNAFARRLAILISTLVSIASWYYLYSARYFHYLLQIKK